ncbi:fatty acid-binding protein, muscle-like isoform X1 [Colias croceus]|uniref:fatty acid-binding protein, muscle-like isoform X1 n=2 Tax=Colias crocea TaxID=72248 RepID=UPI001E27F264|nr:fatty acid-binding protein, muscle-like isoform X1 [Colias croceus]
MSFSGKKYKRTRCENIEELVKESSTKEIITMFEKYAPTVCFTRLDEHTFQVDLRIEARHLSHSFKLGEEQEWERRDGSKLRITYQLEGDNVLHQIIKLPDGKMAYFRRLFIDRECIMTVTLDDTPHTATIYYEQVP